MAVEGPRIERRWTSRRRAARSATRALAQGLSLRALSARAGLPYSTLSKLENGKMALTYDKLIRLAQALNVDLKDILAGPDERGAPVAVGRRSVTRAGEELGRRIRRSTCIIIRPRICWEK